jgi:hypothetical protein
MVVMKMRKKMANGDTKAMMKALSTWGSFFGAVIIIAGGIVFFTNLSGSMDRGFTALAEEHEEVAGVHEKQVAVLQEMIVEVRQLRVDHKEATERLSEQHNKMNQMFEQTSRTQDKTAVLLDQILRRLERGN